MSILKFKIGDSTPISPSGKRLKKFIDRKGVSDSQNNGSQRGVFKNVV